MEKLLNNIQYINIYGYFKETKLLVLNLFMFIYITSNLIGGERGLNSFFEKKKTCDIRK